MSKKGLTYHIDIFPTTEKTGKSESVVETVQNINPDGSLHVECIALIQKEII